ncbi:Molybdenum cofactor sulfurase [Morella rubra]|uniref:Molybdenum cofactor sulfurase n=1 Tax=Morella rubra TaxID=262757 RepID=A0A6A1VWM6_9ROSI|nr:Molybdenum cofactor sulfurase [Morella rubra]
MHSSSIRDACFRGCCPAPILCLLESESPTSKSTASTTASRYIFVEAAASSLYPNTQFTNHESLPALHESFSNFTRAFPNYSRTDEPDHIRAQEYNHLTLCNHVCLDYIGHGLFSHAQHQSHSKKALDASSSSSPPPSPQFPEAPNFRITYKSVNLNSQILYGGQESEIESKLRIRIMAFMNISQVDYTMVFTANQSSAFKLLAECYPFQSNRNLLMVYDYENEAVEVMAESSKKKGARIMSAQFSWPNLSIQSRKLRKMIMKSRNKGLFVFPLQSRMTGSRYSYQWMSTAQENGWHVLLDACALGPKDMDTLGLSLFKPDFVICSFYKVFGEDPSGFGCLFVKKSSASILKDSTTATSIGIVSLVAASRTSQFLEEQESTDMEIEPRVKFDPRQDDLAMLHSFSDQLYVQQRSGETSKSHEIEEVSTKQKIISCSESMESEDDLAVPQSFSGSLSFQQKSGENSKSRESEEASVKQKAVSFSETMGLETPFESARFKYPDGSINGSSEIECRGLDHADSLGLMLISNRARYLINWLVNALMSLQHPHSESGHPLVRIYGPKINFDRGPAMAFNVFDWKGEKIDPSIVQKLADRKNISLSSGVLHHICFSDKDEEAREKALERRRIEVEGMVITKKGQIPVVTAALAFLTNFEDIYRLWAFVSRFLDADFVEKERWRYTALNQKKVEV